MVNELIDVYSLEVVQAYMDHIQHNAEVAVREMLKSIGTRIKMRTQKETEINAIDYLDDGSPIKLRVDLDIEKGEAIFDFRYVFLIKLIYRYTYYTHIYNNYNYSRYIYFFKSINNLLSSILFLYNDIFVFYVCKHEKNTVLYFPIFFFYCFVRNSVYEFYV